VSVNELIFADDILRFSYAALVDMGGDRRGQIALTQTPI
jgi:hypothetical protein